MKIDRSYAKADLESVVEILGSQSRQVSDGERAIAIALSAIALAILSLGVDND